MLKIVLTSSESDQYSSAPKEISKFPLLYMTGYFCRSVYKSSFESNENSQKIESGSNCAILDRKSSSVTLKNWQ